MVEHSCFNQYYRPVVGPLTPAIDAKITKEVKSLRCGTYRDALCGPSTYITVASVNGQIAGFAKWIAPFNRPKLHRPLSLYERLVRKYCKVRQWIVDKLPRSWFNWLYLPHLGEAYRKSWSLSGQSNNAFFDLFIPIEDQKTGCWYLSTLMVRPGYQRMGIGKSLMREGLDRIDKSGVKVYTTASVEGSGLYSQMGFQSIAKREDGDDQHGKWVDDLMCYTPCREDISAQSTI